MCVEDEILCSWPSEDGRSSQARKRRTTLKAEAEVTNVDKSDPSAWMMDTDWLDSLNASVYSELEVWCLLRW